MSNDDANNIISRAKVMMNLAKEVFNKTQAPIMSHQSNGLDHASSLLLFSHPDSIVLCEYDKASERLNNVVSNYGFEVLPVDGDGDCCFTSVGYGIEKFFDLDPSPLTDHLRAINIYKNQDVCERVVRLRELVVMEWLGEYSHEYEMFLTVADKSSFYEMAQQFIQRGVFDCELGNSVLMALSNVLKCPVVIFTSIDTYPIIPLIPRQAPLSAIPIYVAFNQSGKGHYDAIASQIQCDARVENESQSIETSCRCGRGSNKETGKSICSDYSSRCKCFQRIQGCSDKCGCKNCNNPYGKRVANETKTISRKRRKHDNTPKTSGDFFADHGEEFPRNLWNDYDHFILQQIVYSQVAFGEQEPDYDRLYETFLFVFKLTGSTTTSVQSKDKVTRIIKNILAQRKLVLSSLQREMERSWSS
jgi:hypothetical protein